jgi:hypothetical protein
MDKHSPFEQQFADAEQVSVEISLLKETYAEIVALIERNGWGRERGLQMLLTSGLGYAKGQLLTQADDEEHTRMLQRLIDCESMYAVIKYEAFHLLRDNQALEMREAALRNSTRLLEQTLARLRLENAALADRVRALSAAGETHAGPPAAAEPPAPPRKQDPSAHHNWLVRLARALRP